MVSSNHGSRVAFDSLVAKLTGAPLPGASHSGCSCGYGILDRHAVRAGAGRCGRRSYRTCRELFWRYPRWHVALADSDDRSQHAAQHAALAMRASTDLAAMKLHAGQCAECTRSSD